MVEMWRTRSRHAEDNDDTWTARDLPVLRAVVDIYEETGRSVIRASDIESAVGMDKATVQRALRALNSQPSFFEKVTGALGGEILMVGGRVIKFVGLPIHSALEGLLWRGTAPSVR